MAYFPINTNLKVYVLVHSRYSPCWTTIIGYYYAKANIIHLGLIYLNIMKVMIVEIVWIG